jgi:TonB-linked SusC/RagA family outer membrane protein
MKLMEKTKIRDAMFNRLLDRLWNLMRLCTLLALLGTIQTWASSDNSKHTLKSDQAAGKNLQQPRTITGTITDKEGNPLVGANIIIRGTTKGAITDLDGKYEISGIEKGDILMFSYIGMISQEVTLTDQATIDISLSAEALGIDEVVIVGYGTQKKVNLTGAVGKATSERFENRPIPSVGHGLQGVIPGLNVNIRNGNPTWRADYNIRGVESINGGAPLILVDGVPMELDHIDPNDIKSVNVLKDAAASAIYGSRAAFGVILVETKTGKRGKVDVNLSTELSWAKPIFLMDIVSDPYTYVQEYNEASKRAYGTPEFDENYVDGTKTWSENPTHENAWGVHNGELQFYGYNNYQNELITKFAPQQKYGLNISGGSDRASYYISFGYLNKDGYLNHKEKNEHYKRYNALVKVDFKVAGWLDLDSKVAFNSESSDKPHFYNWDVNINTSARVSPIQPIQFPDLPYYVEPGDRDKYEQYIGMYFKGKNFWPYLLHGGRNTYTSYDPWFTQGITITPLKGLKIRGNFSFNAFTEERQNVASKVQVVMPGLLEDNMLDYGFSGDDEIINNSKRSQYYVFNAYAEYTLETNPNHFFRAMVGYNQELGKYQDVRAVAKSLITPMITDLNATTGMHEVRGGQSEVALAGVFYRVNYRFKDKYLIEANGRYDGTSRFPKKDRFGFFPSVSAGWRISNEGFMAGTSHWLDNLKIRASYGELGNQILLNDKGKQLYYPYIPSMPSGSATYLMEAGSRITYVEPPGLVSPTLTWETVSTKNLGLDLSVLRHKLDVSFDLFQRQTKDMLMAVKYSDVLGTEAPKQNAADLKNNGWELLVNWRDRIGVDWDYGISLALADAQAEITRYENPTNAINEYRVGQKLGEIWGFETVGIFQYEADVAAAPDQSKLGTNWRAGDMQYADLNGDGKIDGGSMTMDEPGDLKIIGNTTARYTYGLNGNLRFKNWSLNIFFQGVLKKDFLPNPYLSHCAFYPYNSQHMEKYFLTDCWSDDNRGAYFSTPMVSISNKKNIRPQSRFVQNAAYIRLKNVTLSYSFPLKWIRKIGLSNAQLYLAGMNLWEYTKIRKPLDPEVITLIQEYYKQRIYSFGANITF